MKNIKTIIIICLLTMSISCVQETHVKTVTFKVDMNAIENPQNVGIRGSFTSNPWTETAPLSDDNNDGIYEGTFSQKTAINQVEFKFVNNGSEYELKDSDNRVIAFEYKPETIIYESIFNNEEAKITRK
ncbi:hypothetical protein [uncultured Winogradskyella sp.]|uniref:hypothetical protein n=1 Tax=uncultured Winogradskyella sp. TaxID=395353 RepID=UPI002631EFD9|nr:hypothetical protein [uncultured Winogradskyella sp.]